MKSSNLRPFPAWSWRGSRGGSLASAHRCAADGGGRDTSSSRPNALVGQPPLNPLLGKEGKGVRWSLIPWLLLLALSASAQDLALNVPPSGAEQIVTIPLSTADLDALKLSVTDPAQVVAAAKDDAGWHALQTQWDAPVADGDPALLTVSVPPDDAASEKAVWLTSPGAPPRLVARGGGLAVTQDADAVTIESADYAVTHAKAKGGLPSRIVLRPSGKVFETFDLNDRVYDKQLGGFYLRKDPEPRLEVIANGPLVTIVRVTAYYTNDAGQRPASAPRATYLFRYQAGSPVVTVMMTASQDQPFAWRELHGLEINFPDQSFPGYIAGSPRIEKTFVADETAASYGWAAFRDGDSLVGIFAAGGVKTYDGRGGYGTYLHGPWIGWTAASQTMAANLYLSGSSEGAARIESTVAGWRRPGEAWVAPVASLQTAEGLSAGLADRPAPVAGRLRWWLSLAKAEFRRQHLAEGAARIRAIAAAQDQFTDAPAMDQWFAANTGLQSLVSDRMAAAFDGARLVSLYDQQANRELLAEPTGLWQLQLRDADKVSHPFGPDLWPDKLPADARINPRIWESEGAQTLELTCAGLPLSDTGLTGPTVRATYSVLGGRMSIALAVDNKTALSVWDIECPRLRVGALGDQGSDDVFFFPRGSGEIQRDPVGTGVNWGGLYPGGWSTMQYLAVYDQDGGLYIGAEDPVASAKETFASGPSGANGNLYGVRWPAPDQTKAGNGWTLPGRAALELFDGDWYDAARIYRGWASREAQWWPARAKEKVTPDWVRELPFWVLSSGTAYEPNNVVARTIATAEFMDVPTALHWYNWSQIPFDDDYPHYNPARPDTPQGVKELQAAGIKVMPYINGRLWDSELDDFKQTAHKYATKKEDGTPYIETYGSKIPLAPMCPYTEFWQREQQTIVTWLTQEVGVDGVYLDQIGAAKPVLCYDASHGHPLGGGHWWTTSGYWPMLAGMRAELPKDKFLTTECNAEPYMQYIDGYLTWHWQYQNQVPAFSAVYADQVALFSRAYRGGPTQDLADRMKAAQQLVFGEQIGWINPGIEQRPAGAFMKQCVKLRLALKDYLAHGEMRRPPALPAELDTVTADWRWQNDWPVTLPVVQTGAWQATDGRVVVIAANVGPDAVKTTLTIRPDELGAAGRPAKVIRRTMDGESTVPAPDLTQPWVVEIPAETVVAYELIPGGEG